MGVMTWRQESGSDSGAEPSLSLGRLHHLSRPQFPHM